VEKKAAETLGKERAAKKRRHVKDRGTVIAAEGPLALVKVDCARGCRECSASSLCKGASAEEGTLSVQNPINAHPGDEVVIEVPEGRYHRVLIGMFAALLAAALIGALAGYALSGPLALDEGLSGPLGFFLGLSLAVPGIILYFRKNNGSRLYPSITDITQKGDRHG
jgi:positive regulator of sigma E activity